jgi:hypothetical protein
MDVVEEDPVGKFYDDAFVLEEQLRGFVARVYDKLTKGARTYQLLLWEDIRFACGKGKLDLTNEQYFETACAWLELDEPYRSLLAAEVIRRCTLASFTKHGLFEWCQTQKGAFPEVILFSQEHVNVHFKGLYIGQPEWIANKQLLDVAETLKGLPIRSMDFRINIHLYDNAWAALNNRGYATHIVAGVRPLRLVPVCWLSSEEAKRKVSETTTLENESRTTVQAPPLGELALPQKK